MDVKGFGFLFDKLGFDAGMVCANGWMVVISVSGWDFRCWGGKMTLQRDAFGANPEGVVKIRSRIVRSEGASCGVNHGLEIRGPVPVTISIFTAQPAKKIAVNKMEAKESASIDVAAMPAKVEGRVGGWERPCCAEHGDRSAGGGDAQVDVAAPWNASLVAGPAIGRI